MIKLMTRVINFIHIFLNGQKLSHTQGMLQIAWHNFNYTNTNEITSQPIPIPDNARKVQIKLDATHTGTLDIDYMNPTTRVFHQHVANANSGTVARSTGGNFFYMEPVAGNVLRLRWTSSGSPGTLSATIETEE